MHSDLMNHIGRQLAESNSGLFGRLFETLGGAYIGFMFWLGTVNASFIRIFDPATWTAQDIASFCTIPVAVMYFIKLHYEKKLARRKLDLVDQRVKSLLEEVE